MAFVNHTYARYVTESILFKHMIFSYLFVMHPPPPICVFIIYFGNIFFIYSFDILNFFDIHPRTRDRQLDFEILLSP